MCAVLFSSLCSGVALERVVIALVCATAVVESAGQVQV